MIIGALLSVGDHLTTQVLGGGTWARGTFQSLIKTTISRPITVKNHAKRRVESETTTISGWPLCPILSSRLQTRCHTSLGMSVENYMFTLVISCCSLSGQEWSKWPAWQFGATVLQRQEFWHGSQVELSPRNSDSSVEGVIGKMNALSDILSLHRSASKQIINMYDVCRFPQSY